MQNEIFRCDVSFISVRGLRKGKTGRGGGEGLCTSEVEMVEMPGARPPPWPRRRIYAPMMSSDSRVFGEGQRLDAHARRPSHSCCSFQLPLLCSGRLKVLSVFTRAKTSSQGYLYCFICPPRFLSLPTLPPPHPPHLLLASVRSHSLSSVSLSFKHVALFFPSSRPFSPVVPREMSSSAPHVVCLIVGAFV